MPVPDDWDEDIDERLDRLARLKKRWDRLRAEDDGPQYDQTDPDVCRYGRPIVNVHLPD